MLRLIRSITEAAWFRLSLFILLAANLVFGLFFLTQTTESNDYDLSLAEEAITLLDKYGYYGMLENDKLNHSLIKGMLSDYGDPYTSFYTPPDHEVQMDRLTGKFGGIGINLFINSEGLYVITPYEESPATEAGIENGDILLTIDKKFVEDFSSINEILAYLHAEEGTVVTIDIWKTETKELTTLEIERREIHQPSVHSFIVHQNPSIAVLDINIIGAETPKEITTIIENHLVDGVQHFIIDLQTNYGGFLTEALEISKLFLPKGIILSETDSSGQTIEFMSDEDGDLMALDLVILVNDQTASAAEIISGILQTYGHYPVIGSHTYGKDTIQLVFELGDKSSMHITHAKWMIPDLTYDFEIMGIQPDIQVDPGEEFSSRSLQAAIEYIIRNP